MNFNIHVSHSQDGLADAAMAFRSLIDLAINHGGSYYLTYHRYATRDQVERCYPGLRELLELKLKYDPSEVFQSEWYRHYKKMLLGRDVDRQAYVTAARLAPKAFWR